MPKDHDIHFEESLFDEGSGNARRAVPVRVGVFILTGACALALMGALFIRTAFLNSFFGSFYAARAAANSDKEFILPAYRGIITDRFGAPLVKNISRFRVSIDVNELFKSALTPIERAGLFKKIAAITGEPDLVIRAAVTNADLEKNPRVVVGRALSLEQAIDARALQNDAVIIEDDYVREYVDPFVFSALLGYTGSAEVSGTIAGKAGLEASHDDVLRGVDGVRIVYRDARGMAFQEKRVREAVAGATLTTTIDAPFQRYFYERFTAGLTELNKTSGVGIAMNPKTGEVLALVSFPSFDNNNPAAYLNDSLKPLFNRAISGVFSPGSTIKPLVALAALHERLVTPLFTVHSPGYLELPNPYNPDHPSRFLDWRPQGVVDMYSALARSSNVYFYVVGGGCTVSTCNAVGRSKGLGIYTLNEYWKKFGLDAITDIDLAGEAVGFLPNPEEKQKRTGTPWRIGDTYNVSIGQGDLGVTPIRLLTFFSSIANKGIMMQPHLRYTESPAALMDYSSWTDELAVVRQGLRDVVLKPYGTANALYDLPYKTAGKTGSAQFANNVKTNAFFIGYGPAHDAQIAVLILVEDAKTGSLNAVPIGKDVLKWYYDHRL